MATPSLLLVRQNVAPPPTIGAQTKILQFHSVCVKLLKEVLKFCSKRQNRKKTKA